MRLVACLAVLLAAVDARADAEADAKAYFDTGQRAFNEGDYEGAVSAFQAVYRLKPYPDVLMNIATCYERIYEPEKARETYEKFLREAPDTPAEAALRTLAQTRLRWLARRRGKILVEANKEGALVRIVGDKVRRQGPSPLRADDLPPGRYQIHVELPYHKPFDHELTLGPGGSEAVPVELEHEVETLTIFTRPPGARVFIDDREEGVTPFSHPVDVGQKRRLRLEAEDFPPWVEAIDVLPGRPVERRITFKKPTRSGRSELVLGAMAYAAAGSVFIAEAAGSSKLSGELRLGLDLLAGIVGTGVGFLVAALVTDDYVKVGHSSIIIGGTAWGTVIGSALALGLKLSDTNTIALALLGSGLGLGAGIVTARINDTSPGDAAIVNSGGIWGSMAGLLLAQALEFRQAPDPRTGLQSPDNDRRDQALGWLTLSGCAAGIVVASFLAWGIEVSRGHVAIVDALGLAGLALAFAVGYGITPTDPNCVQDDSCGYKRLANGARFGLGGMTVGLLAGAILSRKYKDDLPPTEALFMRHGGRWAFGLPEVRVTTGLAPQGLDARLTVDLARGEF